MPTMIEQEVPVAASGALSGASSVIMINIQTRVDAHGTRTSFSMESGALHVTPDAALDGRHYPVLVGIWDNESDAIFDTI